MSVQETETLDFHSIVHRWYLEELGPLHSHIGYFRDVVKPNETFYFDTVCDATGIGEPRYVLAWCYNSTRSVRILNWTTQDAIVKRSPNTAPLNAGDPQFFEKLKTSLITAHNALGEHTGCKIV